MRSGMGRATGGHASDGELLRLLDGEGPASERARVTAHVGACEVCRGRLERVRRDRDVFFDALDAAEPALPLPPRLPTPRTAAPSPAAGAASGGEALIRDLAAFGAGPQRAGGAGAPWLRAAVVVLVVVGGLVSAPPVRAWVSAGLERMSTLLEEPEAPVAPEASTLGVLERFEALPPASPASPLEEVAVEPNATTVAFVPEDGSFLVEVEQAQAGAVLVLRIVETPSAWIEVRGGGRKGIMVRQDGLVIAGAGTEGARYELTLPIAVRQVTVTLAGEPLAEIVTAASPLPLERTFPLSRDD